jgi:uroporphyrinogen III methyltransferase/synthase
VVRLREPLNWFETRPLFGRTIVVTRAREQASELSRQLEDLGAHVIEMPTIRIVEPDDYGPLDQALSALATFDWIVFTSPNGVDHFVRRLFAKGQDVRGLAGLRLATIGPATTERLRACCLTVDCEPATHTAEGLLETLLKAADLKGRKFLIPRATEAREALPAGLREAGAEVVEVPAYKTLMAEAPDPDTLALLKQGEIDFVTFTSSSTVRNFVTMVGVALPPRVRFASIGPVTTQTARELGISVAIESKEITIPSLVEAIASFARGDRGQGAGHRRAP